MQNNRSPGADHHGTLPIRALGRIAVFIKERFPPAVQIPFGVAHFLAVYLTLQALAGRTPVVVDYTAVLGAASLILFLLLLRVYDELKDWETDQQLAGAGDPQFADRPQVTGKATLGDLRILRGAVTALLVVLNLLLWDALALSAFAVAFLLTWLSFKWFFWPAISHNLLLAFATHNPLALVLSGYVAALCVARFPTISIDGWAALLLFGLWMPIAAWETSRKIRVPEDETDYQTYSKMLGWKTAALVPGFFASLSLLSLWALAWRAQLDWIFPALLLLAWGGLVGACVRFRVAPTRRRARLRRFAEIYLLAANVGLPVAIVAKYPLSLA